MTAFYAGLILGAALATAACALLWYGRRALADRARDGEGGVDAAAELRAHQDILGELTLYVRWRWLTKQLATEDKERWAGAYEQWRSALHDYSSATLISSPSADRWWLCPTYGESIEAKPGDGPHEHCIFAGLEEPYGDTETKR